MSMSENPEQFDVIIVGMGPTGMTLANLLGHCGVDVLIIDRFHDPYPLPRAVHFDDEIMRVFQAIGVAEEVSQIVRVNVGMRFVGAKDRLLLDWPRPQEIGAHGWHASYRFHQPELEVILRRALIRYDNVQMLPGHEVAAVRDLGACAEVTIQSDDGSATRAFASYVVGCDGANSIVREAMNITETDLGFKERWLVSDLFLQKPKPELGDHTVQYCNPDRSITYARGPGYRRRWEIALHDDEDADHMCKRETVWKLLSRWIKPEEAQIERSAVYTFQSVIADQWRSGRLLIAGDAAHRTPPFMGQGLCAGIRDAANLAWKLARVTKSRAPEAFLDSYGSERTPHAREYIETAIRLGRLINASATEEALKAAFRQPDGTVRMETISPSLGPGLFAGDSALAGTIFPQPDLKNGTKLDDRVGYEAFLAIDADFRQLVGSKIDLNNITPVGSDESAGIGNFLKANELAAILVRPDRYVLGTAKTAEELEHVLRKWHQS